MIVTPELIEALLFEEEGTTIEFKSAQYSFSGADDEAKGELLKDIISLANAFRRESAYILVGVKEVKGGRSQIVGVSQQLEDAHLQEFVNKKTQRPIEFSYRAATHDGLPIGIIQIPRQKRPIYLTKNFGKLAAQAVYIRRGSSTAVASPEEVAQMGRDELIGSGQPCLNIQFGDRESLTLLGNDFRAETLVLKTPPTSEIPDFAPPLDEGQFYWRLSPNRDYTRQLLRFVKDQKRLTGFSLAVRNTGDVLANDVRLVLEISDPEKILDFVVERDLSDRPEQYPDYSPIIALNRARPVPRHLWAKRVGDVWVIEALIGKIQPKALGWLSEKLYVGARRTTDVVIPGQAFADNLCQPSKVEMRLLVETREEEADLSRIAKLDDDLYLGTSEGKRWKEMVEKGMHEDES